MSQNGHKLAPAPKGNTYAVRHGAFARFTPADLEEVRALEDEIRAVCPIESPSIEPAVSVLAGLLWRRAKLYTYIEEHGITRGRADRATLNPALQALDMIERQVMEAMRQLAMLPKAAADLGKTLAETPRGNAGPEFNLTQLTSAERAELQRLLDKAEA